MGYKLPYINVSSNGNTASAILDLNGPKYLILVLDDFNQNHVNNSIVSITQYSNILKPPSYYTPDLPYTCITPSQNNLNQLISSDNGLLIAGKFENDYSPTQIIFPSVCTCNALTITVTPPGLDVENPIPVLNVLSTV